MPQDKAENKRGAQPDEEVYDHQRGTPVQADGSDSQEGGELLRVKRLLRKTLRQPCRAALPDEGSAFVRFVDPEGFTDRSRIFRGGADAACCLEDLDCPVSGCLPFHIIIQVVGNSQNADISLPLHVKKIPVAETMAEQYLIRTFSDHFPLLGKGNALLRTAPFCSQYYLNRPANHHISKGIFFSERILSNRVNAHEIGVFAMLAEQAHAGLTAVIIRAGNSASCQYIVKDTDYIVNQFVQIDRGFPFHASHGQQELAQRRQGVGKLLVLHNAHKHRLEPCIIRVAVADDIDNHGNQQPCPQVQRRAVYRLQPKSFPGFIGPPCH